MSLVDNFITEMRNIGVICVRQINKSKGVLLLLQGQGNKLKANVQLPTGILSTADEETAMKDAVYLVKLQLSQRNGTWAEEEQAE